MSIAVDATAHATAFVNGGSVSWTHVVGSGSGRAIAVLFYVTSLSGSASATVAGVDMGAVRVSRTWNFAVDNHLYLFVLTNPTSGSVTITCSVSDGINLFGGSVSFTGVDSTTPVGNTASADDAGLGGSPATVNVSSASGEVVIDAVYAKHSSGDMTANQTEQWHQGLNTNQETLGQETANGAASVTMSWTLPGLVDTWAIVALGLKPSVVVQDLQGAFMIS